MHGAKKIGFFTHFESSKVRICFLMIVHDIQVNTLLLISQLSDLILKYHLVMSCPGWDPVYVIESF